MQKSSDQSMEQQDMNQEELENLEKFRTFFTTSVAQVPEEMLRHAEEREEKKKISGGMLSRFFRKKDAAPREPSSSDPESDIEKDSTEHELYLDREDETGEIRLEPVDKADLLDAPNLGYDTVLNTASLSQAPARVVKTQEGEASRKGTPTTAPARTAEKRMADIENQKPTAAPAAIAQSEKEEDKELKELKELLDVMQAPKTPKPKKTVVFQGGEQAPVAPKKSESEQPALYVKPYLPERPGEPVPEAELPTQLSKPEQTSDTPTDESERSNEPDEPIETPLVSVEVAEPSADSEPATDEAPTQVLPDLKQVAKTNDDAENSKQEEPTRRWTKRFRFFGRGEDETPQETDAAEDTKEEDTITLPPVETKEQTDKPDEPTTQFEAELPIMNADIEQKPEPQTREEIGENLKSMNARLTLRCVLSGILAVALLGLGLMEEGLLPATEALDPVAAPIAFMGANLLLLLLALAVSFRLVRDGLIGLVDEPTADSLPAIAAVAAVLQAVVALMGAEQYRPSGLSLMSGMAALLLFLDTLGSRIRLTSIREGYDMISNGVAHRGAYRVKDKDLIRCLADENEEQDPWILLSRPMDWSSDFIDQSFSERASERTAQKMARVLLGCGILSGIVILILGRGVASAVSAMAAMICMGAPLSSTLLAGLSGLRMERTAGAVGAVVPGWAAVEELGGIDTIQVDASDLFTPDCAQLVDIRMFKGGRIDKAILYTASILNQGCNTLSGLFRRIIEDRTDILLPVKDLEKRRGLGFAAWCDNCRVLVGTRAMMEQEGVPLPDEDYEKQHSKNGELHVLYLAVAGNMYAMFLLKYTGGRNAARGLSVLQRENIRLLVSCDDPTLTAQRINDVYRLPEGLVRVLNEEQCRTMEPALSYLSDASCCMVHLQGFASLTGGLYAAEKAQNAEKFGTSVQVVSVVISILIGLLLTYAGSIGTLSLAAVLMYQAAWSALSIALAMMKQH